jgi:hypothetical protein
MRKRRLLCNAAHLRPVPKTSVAQTFGIIEQLPTTYRHCEVHEMQINQRRRGHEAPQLMLYPTL